MKRLLLLRHAKAVPAEEPLADIARPLAERGQRDARRIGDRLRQGGLGPELILTSPSLRTLQTAQLVATALDLPPSAIASERTLYLAEPAVLLAAIGAQDTAIESLLVVGHNPGLTELAHQLLPTFEVDDLPTGAVIALDYPADTAWAQLETGTARLAYYDFPKNPREPLTAR
jgi:phosphohistidine phosphatase